MHKSLLLFLLLSLSTISQCMLSVIRVAAAMGNTQALSNAKIPRMMVFYKKKPHGSIRAFATTNNSPNQAFELVRNLIEKNENATNTIKELTIHKFTLNEINDLLAQCKKSCSDYSKGTVLRGSNLTVFELLQGSVLIIVGLGVHVWKTPDNYIINDVMLFISLPIMAAGMIRIVEGATEAINTSVHIPSCIKYYLNKRKFDNAQEVFNQLQRMQKIYGGCE